MPEAARLPEAFERYPLRTTRGGHFWIPGEIVELADGQHVQRAPLYVRWEAPAEITKPYPLVLVHGGGGQLTDWEGTPDGRPGWFDRFVDEGYLVYGVDRPAHGRSWAHPDVVGKPGGMFTYELALGLFSAEIPGHDQGVWEQRIGDPVLDQMVASMGYFPDDLAESQRLDQDRIARLLDRIGPAILITHSAGGPAGWLVADARPELVKGVFALEPMGPPFTGAFATLDYGITKAPLTYDPPFPGMAELEAAAPGEYTLPNFKGIPMVVAVSAASPFTSWGHTMSDFINAHGGSAEFLNLGDVGVHGNGHAPMFEKNSDEAIRPILDWLAKIQ